MTSLPTHQLWLLFTVVLWSQYILLPQSAVSASLVSELSAKPAELLKNHYFIPTRETETVKGGETLIAQQVSLLQQLVRSLTTSLFPLALTIRRLSIISSKRKLLQRPRCWEFSVASQPLVIKT